ncbi:MAG: PilZ domain-containing protein [Spirochaetes bacterium]|jgi:hypothetical protein|nr:PilZ domain-containing protein [Spirochaetota bacterium]
MNTIITYEKLSGKLRNEIEMYHENRIRKGLAQTIQDSVKEWFNNHFESWLFSNGYGVDNGNKRRFVRIDIELPLKISRTLIDSSSEEAIEITGTVKNISRGGLFFRSSKILNISSIIRVIICLSDIEESLTNVEALAMITRCHKYGENDYGIGVVFSSIYNEQMEGLSSFIFHHLVYYVQLDD